MKTIVHCGAPSAKRNEDLFRQLLEEFDPLQPSTLYLVAGRFRRRQLEARFLAVHPDAFEIPVLTLPDLARALSRAHSSSSRMIDENAKNALLEEILDEDGLHLGQADFRNGALPYISQFVAFIKSRNISEPEMLELRYRKSQREPSPLERELIRVFARYQALLRENGLEDAEDEQIRVYSGLLTGSLDLSRVFPGLRRVVLEGIYRLSPLQAGTLHHLSQAVGEAVVSIGGLQFPQFDPNRPEWDFLDGPGLEWVRHQPAKSVQPLFSRPATRAEEVTALARQIADLSGSRRDLRLEEIAVVCPSPDRYRDLLAEVFGDFGVSFHYASGTPARESASVALLLKYLRVVDEDFSSDSLFDFFDDPRVRIQGLSFEALRLLERVVVKSGIDGRRGSWDKEFPDFVKLCADQARETRPERSVQIKAASEVFLDALRRLNPDVKTPRTLFRWREDVLTRLQPFWAAPEEEGDRGASIDNRLFREFWSRLASACVAVSTTRTFPFRQFKALVERQLAQTRVRLDKEEQGVVVGSPRELQQASFQHLFWIGLTDGEFPESVNQHIFFDDVRSSQWGFATWEERLEESRWLFSSLNASARQGLYLSCPLKTADAPLTPSAFWRELRSETGLHQDEEHEAGGLAAFQFHLSTEARENARRGIAVQWLRESGAYSPYQGFFGSPALVRLREELFHESFELSPSQLENYVRCGFRYFAEKVLRLVPLDERATEITPRERGNLIHAILFRFVAELEEPCDFSDETRQAWIEHRRLRMGSILEQELARLRREKQWRDELFWAHEEKLLGEGLADGVGRGVLAEFVDQQWERLRSHRFEAVELRVGPVDLGAVADFERARLVPVRLRGKVDRLDAGPRGLSVIDYKTGQDQLPRVYQGWGFQLPLYIFMLRQLRREPIEGAAFYAVQGPDEVRLREVVAMTVDGDPKKGLDRLIDYYQKKAMEAARSLFDGRFPVTLLGPSNAGCRVCPLSGVCRYDGAAVEPARRSGHFPIDEPIIQRGRWIEQPEAETTVVPSPVQAP